MEDKEREAYKNRIRKLSERWKIHRREEAEELRDIRRLLAFVFLAGLVLGAGLGRILSMLLS